MELDQRVNETQLVLIPKVKDPKYVKDFRPISLCNVLMRISEQRLYASAYF